jgi:spore coat protein CotH
MPSATSRRTATRIVWLAACAAMMLACQPGGGVPSPVGSAAMAPLLKGPASLVPSPKGSGDQHPPRDLNGVLGYSAETHGKLARPNYAAAFPQDRVPKFTIKVAPAAWQAMLDDMAKNFGARGRKGGPSGSAWRPAWAEATIEYAGRVWEHVGLRFKGNSSLRSAWSSGSDKIPFKLDFNQFGDKYADTQEQRFHGFKQLSLSTNWSDASAMRETIVYDLLGDAGLPAAETAAYELVLDHGKGPVSLGLYTSNEVVDDTVVKRVFGNDKGNIYEGDGAGVSLAAGTRDRIAASYPKENNDGSDWSDVEALYDALHDPLRKTDATAWRAKLEAIFDVDVFLHWLAIAAIVEHWDTYGGMPHNFYLYNTPATGKLTWISWDHNLVLGAMTGGAPGGLALSQAQPLGNNTSAGLEGK